MTPAKDLSSQRLIRLIVLDFGLFDVGPGHRLIGIPGFFVGNRGWAGIGGEDPF